MRHHALIALLLAALTLAVYAPVRNHSFVDYDDHIDILDNPNLREGLGLKSIARSFAQPYHSNWIPLTYLSLRLNYTLHGLEPAGYLLANVGLHLASTLLLFYALARMTGAVGRSAFVAAVFAVHPLHVESVAWAAERKDVLCGFFWMLALLAYARYVEKPGSRARYAGVAASLSLALLAKPMAVTLPFALLLLDYWPLGRLRTDASRRLPDPSRLLRAVVEKLPLLALATAASAIAFTVQQASGTMNSLTGRALPLSLRLANATYAYAIYLADGFWPRDLAVFYPHPLDSLSTLQVGGSLLLIAALSAAAISQAAARPYALVGWLWYLGTLVPVVGLVQIGTQARADRYMYLPLVGLALIVAWGTVDAVGPRRRVAKWLPAAGAAAVLALAGAASLQLRHWRDSLSLFERAVAVTERNYVAQHRLGAALVRVGRLEEARDHYVASLRIAPRRFAPHFELAQFSQRLGDWEAAADHYGKAVGFDSGHARARAGWGLALLRLGRLDEARPQLERALELDPEAADVHAGLGAIAAVEGSWPEAFDHNRQALSLDPGQHGAANNLAWILATCNDEAMRAPEESIRIAREALEDVPGPTPSLLDTLAAGYAAAGRFGEAVETAQRAAALAIEEGQGALADEIGEHLELYLAGQPLIEHGCSAAETPPEAAGRP